MSTASSDRADSPRTAPHPAAHDRASSRAINLTFHGVGEPTRRLEPGEADVWLSSAQLSSILDAVASRTDVRITFDDGNASDVHTALPALRARGLTATFFVVAGRLGTPGFLDDEDVGALAAAGMAIGCHGMRHRPWRKLNGQEMHEEMLSSKTRLEEIVAQPVKHAACPFGSYDRRVLFALRRYGYDRVFTSDRGTARSDRWLQARNTLGKHDSGDVVDPIVSRDRRLDRALRRQAKLAVKRWR